MDRFQQWRKKRKAAPNPLSQVNANYDPSESPSVSSFPDGVKILHDSADATVDICFIHGLTGDRESTWTANGQSAPWPKTLLPPKLSRARILTYGYDAYIVRKRVAGSNRLIDHATNLLYDLTTDRSCSNASSRPLIFVAHSLGGLVCKKAILLSRNNPEAHLRSVFDCTKGIIFIGTPHKGSWMADWAKIPAAAVGLVKSANKSLLGILETDDQLLESIQVEFWSMVRGLRECGSPFEVTCFFEELPMPVVGKVVSKESATLEGYTAVSIHANHSDMVKFASAEETGFKRLVGELVRWASQVEHSPARQAEKLLQTPQFSAKGNGGASSVNGVSSTQNISSISTGPGTANIAPNQTVHQTIVQSSPSTVPEPSHDCLRSLAFPKMENRLREIESAVAGTCEWLLRHETYKTWADYDRGLLWIKGKPGSGKSTLLKYALNNHEIGGSALVLSFFLHGRGDELQRTPIGLFRSLLHQVLGQAPDALQDLVDRFVIKLKHNGKPGEGWHWHEDELWHFFASSLPKVLKARSVWLFVDALDECGKDNAVKLVDLFKSLLKRLPSWSVGLNQFRICFSCRHYPILDLDDMFVIRLEDENQRDISTFVDDQLAGFRERTSSTIPTLITERASGVFLWAHLVVKQVLDLERQGDVNKIEAAVHSIPPDLDELYLQLIRSMGSASLKLIQWICFSTRPLSTGELRWAMVIEADCSHRSLQAYESAENYVPDNVLMKRKVETLSRGLAEVTRTQVVQFIHQSVKDFFVQKGLSALHGNVASTEAAIRAHFLFSGICVRYLAMDEIAQATSYNDSDFPFLHYATTSWVAHAKQCDAGSDPQGKLLELFPWPSNALLELWVRVYEEINLRSTNIMDRVLEILEPWSKDCPPKGVTLVHVMSRYGVFGLLTAILQRADQFNINVDTKDDVGRTPLSWAAQHGHGAVVQLLLSTGKVDVGTKDSSGRTPLSLAAARGQQAVVQLLLSTGKVDVNAKDELGQTPLLRAAEDGHAGVVQLLLSTCKVDINAEDKDGQTPLSWAAGNGHAGVVQLLLSTCKVDINAEDKDGRTPLSWAAGNGHEGVVRLLLSMCKVDVDAKDASGRTPLSWAAENGHEGVVRLLISMCKVDVDAKDASGRTPLSWAAENGEEGVVRLLLSTCKVDVDAKDDSGDTPLFWAAMAWHEAAIQLLLGTGKVDVNVKDSESGRTLLSSAAAHGDETIVQLLLNTGKVDVDVQDNDGRTPLSLAAKHGVETIVQLLLNTGKVDVDAKDKDGRTPLSWAAIAGHDAVVQLLLSTGKVDVNSKDSKYGLTPLSWAAGRGHKTIVQLLLNMGMVDINAKDSRYGLTPLSLAARMGHEAVVQLLLSTGKVDVDVKDVYG